MSKKQSAIERVLSYPEGTKLCSQCSKPVDPKTAKMSWTGALYYHPECYKPGD